MHLHVRMDAPPNLSMHLWGRAPAAGTELHEKSKLGAFILHAPITHDVRVPQLAKNNHLPERLQAAGSDAGKSGRKQPVHALPWRARPL